MKTLKKLLALFLSIAMLCGSMALAADFTDADEIENVEAATVLQALGLMIGNDKGELEPGEVLTRAEGATLIARAMLGVDVADSFAVSSAPYSDVPANHWAAGYIAYCASQGVVAGKGNDRFDPEGDLTVSEFAKMLLGVLGYESDREGTVGANWEMNAISLSIKAELLEDIAGGYTESCTRDTAALMMLNALKATMVYYASGSVTVESGDTTITVGGSAAEKQSALKSTEGNIEADGWLQLGEYMFSGLVLTTGSASFGRPDTTIWTLDGETIYVGDSTVDLIATYTTSTYEDYLFELVGEDVYDALDDATATLVVYFDGDKVQTPALTDYIKEDGWNGVAGTGAGVLTEIYLDDSDNVTIVQINTYLAVATDDYDEDDGALTIEIYDGSTTANTVTLYEEDGFELADFAEDDWALVTIDDGDVSTIEAPELLVGEVTGYVRNSSVSIDGVSYGYSKHLDASFAKTGFSIGSDITIALDYYGNIIAHEAVSADSKYVYIREAAKVSGVGSTSYEAAAFFPDGSYEIIPITQASQTVYETAKDCWYTYTINSSGNYVLSAIDGAYLEKYNGSYATSNGSIYFVNGNGASATFTRFTASTKFVIHNSVDGDLDLYTGYSSLPTINANYNKSMDIRVVENDSGYATHVYIDTKDATVKGSTTSSDKYLLVYTSYASIGMDSNETEYALNYYVLENGEAVTVYSLGDTALAVGLYTDLSYDENGYLESYTPVTATGDEFVIIDFADHANNAVTYSDGIITIVDGSDNKEYSYALAEDYQIIITGTTSYDTYTASNVANKVAVSELAGDVIVVLNDSDEAAQIYFGTDVTP